MSVYNIYTAMHIEHEAEDGQVWTIHMSSDGYGGYEPLAVEYLGGPFTKDEMRFYMTHHVRHHAEAMRRIKRARETGEPL